MGGVIGAMQPRADQWAVAPQARASDTDDVKPSWLQGVGAAFRTGQDQNGWHQAERLGDAYGQIVDDVARASGRDPSYYAGDMGFRLRQSGDAFFAPAQAQYAYDPDKIWADIGAARQRDPNAFKGLNAGSREEFEQHVLTRSGQYQADAQTAAKSGLTANLLGGAGAGFTDPVNLVFGGAAGGFSAGAKTIARGVLAEGLVNAGLAAAQEPGTIDARARLGQQTTAGDVAMDIGSGFVLGAGLHLGVAGLKAAGGAAYDRIPLGYRAATALGKADLPAGANDGVVARAFDASVPTPLRTPDEAAALHVVNRADEVAAASPYVDTYAGQDMHQQRLASAAAELVTGAPRKPVAGRGLDPDIVSFLKGKGASDGQARGIAAGIAAESSSNPGAVNPASGASFLGQWLGARKAALIERFGERPTKSQQMEFLWDELNGGDAGGKHVLAQQDERAVLDAYVRRFMRPKEGLETDGDLARGMAALGRGEDPIGTGAMDGEPGAGAGDDGGVAAADADLRAIDGEAARAGDAVDAAMAPRVDNGIAPAHPSEDLPQLKPEQFDTVEAHRSAQAHADADALGVERVVVARRPTEEIRPTVKADAVPDYLLSKIYVEPTGEPGLHIEPHPGGSLDDDMLTAVFRDGEGKPKGVLTFPANPDGVRFNQEGGYGLTVYVDPEFRGKGIASKLYDAAQDVAPWVNDMSGSHDMTAAGAALARSRRRIPSSGIDMGDGTVVYHRGPSADVGDHAAVESRADPSPVPFTPEDRGLPETDMPVPPDLAAPADVAAMSDPVGPAAHEQLDGMMHDIKAQIDAGELEGLTFALGDGAEQSAAEILAQFQTESAALKALRDCM